MDIKEILRILDSFAKENLDYALIGGVAVNLHGIPRNTEDLDFFVRPTSENIDRLRSALHRVYDDPSIDEISTADLTGDYPAVRYYPPDTELYLDILVRLGEFASYDDLEIVNIEIEGVKVSLVTPQTLFWLKRDTVRDIDRLDARYLLDKFDLEDHPRQKGG